MKRIATGLAVLAAFAGVARADLVNPATLTLTETAPSRFNVELTLPLIQGRVLKARPVLPDVCAIEGEPAVRGDAGTAVRTWSMSCDPDEMIGLPIGVQGLLGTSQDVQLTFETLDGRKHVTQLRPTQAYFLVPAPPTPWRLAVEVGGTALRQALRHPELAILILLGLFLGLRPSGLFAASGAFAVALGFGQWLKTENWIGVSSFLPALLAAAIGLAVSSRILRARGPSRDLGWRTPFVLAGLMGLLYGGAGLPVEMVLSRGERYLAFFLSALGTLSGLGLVVLCAARLRAVVAGFGERAGFWIAYLGGIAACAIGIYQATAPLFGAGLTPTVPPVALLASVALGAWCGAQSTAVRSFLPAVSGCMAAVGLVLGLRGLSLPQSTLGVYGSMALAGLLLLRPVRLPAWAVVSGLAAAVLYHAAHAGAILRESVALPVAQATAMIVLLVFLFLVARRQEGGRALRAFGLATVLLALLWRFAEYRVWIGGEVAADATMGLVRLPVLTVLLVLAALLFWPRKRRFRPVLAEATLPAHWCLVLLALFTISVAGIRVKNPFHTPRAPTAAEARPIMAMLLTDTYLAFNLPDEEAAFDRLARNLSEELVPGVYLDSRRRLTAGTRKGAEVTVKDVSVMSVEPPTGLDAEDGSFTYPCKWVVTARVKHWQHIHDRQNIYVGALTIRVEDDRWKIDELELLSEEREILSWRSS